MKENRKIKLTIGIPASGKSTWRKEFISENPDWVAVSRDEYRLMLANSQMMNRSGENLVTELVENAIAIAIKNGYNVIVDQTNVNVRYLNKMIDFCQKLADIEFVIFDVPLRVAIERDRNRETSVGENVIRRMYKNYDDLILSDFSFAERKKIS